MYLSIYCKVRKGCVGFYCERELETEHKLQYLDPLLLWPSALCLSRSPGLLNRRPGGSALCWVLAFSTTSYQQLLWTPTPSGAPTAPSAWCGLPYQISSITPSPTATPTVLTELYNSSTPSQSPTRSLEWHVWSSSSGNNCHAVHRSLSSGASLCSGTVGPSSCPILSALIRPRDLFRLLAIGMCHFLPAHHFGMACLPGPKAKIQHCLLTWIGDLFVSKSPREFYVSHFLGQILVGVYTICQQGQILISCTILIGSHLPPRHTSSCTPFVSFCYIHILCDELFHLCFISILTGSHFISVSSQFSLDHIQSLFHLNSHWITFHLCFIPILTGSRFISVSSQFSLDHVSSLFHLNSHWITFHLCFISILTGSRFISVSSQFSLDHIQSLFHLNSQWIIFHLCFISILTGSHFISVSSQFSLDHISSLFHLNSHWITFHLCFIPILTGSRFISVSSQFSLDHVSSLFHLNSHWITFHLCFISILTGSHFISVSSQFSLDHVSSLFHLNSHWITFHLCFIPILTGSHFISVSSQFSLDHISSLFHPNSHWITFHLCFISILTGSHFISVSSQFSLDHVSSLFHLNSHWITFHLCFISILTGSRFISVSSQFSLDHISSLFHLNSHWITFTTHIYSCNPFVSFCCIRVLCDEPFHLCHHVTFTCNSVL